MTPKLYKAADVCEMTQLQPYVLRSWEKEFPGIGVQKSSDGPRLYRQADVDQVLRIKQLVFSEGLTLAGARRRLESQGTAPVVSAPLLEEPAEPRGRSSAETAAAAPLVDETRARIAQVREGLRLLLDMVSAAPGTAPEAAERYELRPPAVAADTARRPREPKLKARAVATRGTAPRIASKPHGSSKTTGKRKRASA